MLAWTYANRYVRELSCPERTQYQMKKASAMAVALCVQPPLRQRHYLSTNHIKVTPM
jgi:hypothetical protein